MPLKTSWTLLYSAFSRSALRFVFTEVTFCKIHIFVLFKRYWDFFWTCSFLAKNLSDFIPLVLKLHTTDIDINFKKHFFFLRKGCCSEWLCRQETKLVYSTPSKCVDLKRKLSNGKGFFMVHPPHYHLELQANPPKIAQNQCFGHPISFWECQKLFWHDSEGEFQWWKVVFEPVKKFLNCLNEIGFPKYWLGIQLNRLTHLYLIFAKSSLKNPVPWTGFLTCKNQFAGYTGSKNLVRNRLEIQFAELDFSNLIF